MALPSNEWNGSDGSVLMVFQKAILQSFISSTFSIYPVPTGKTFRRVVIIPIVNLAWKKPFHPKDGIDSNVSYRLTITLVHGESRPE